MKSAEPMEQWVRKLNLATTDSIEWYQYGNRRGTASSGWHYPKKHEKISA